MAHVAIFFATREGHTRAIAEHLAGAIRARGPLVDLFDVARLAEPISLGTFAAVVLAASIHLRRHEPEMQAFAERHRDALERVPTTLLSVSMTEALAEDSTRTTEERAAAAEEVRAMIHRFLEETGLVPAHVHAIAGALPFSRYGPLQRFLVTRIARQAGLADSAAIDVDFTDWISLDRVADEVVRDVPREAVLGG